MVTSMKRARPRRGPERGAALFIVVLVITLLLGIGMFAARTAHLAITASGGARQQMQAHYVAEYALLFAEAKLSNGAAQSYLKAMSNPVDVCQGQQPNTQGRSCYKMQYQDIQSELAANGGFNVCDAPVNAAIPGSLGPVDGPSGLFTVCDFSVELSDKADGFTPSGYTPSSSGPSPTKPFMFWYITGTATGSVGLAPALNLPASNYSVGSQVLRGRFLVGPFPPS
jgi:hypothetical protein